MSHNTVADESRVRGHAVAPAHARHRPAPLEALLAPLEEVVFYKDVPVDERIAELTGATIGDTVNLAVNRATDEGPLLAWADSGAWRDANPCDCHDYCTCDVPDDHEFCYDMPDDEEGG